MSDDEELPVARRKVKDAISEVIDEKGIDSVSSASIRAFLSERFGHDFTAHKKTIDEMTMKKIEKILKKQESDGEKEEKVNEKKEKRQKKDEPVEEKAKEKHKKASKVKEESLDEPVIEKVKKEKHKKASKVVEEFTEKHKKISTVKDEPSDEQIEESVAAPMKQEPIDEPMEEMKLEFPSTVKEELVEVEKEAIDELTEKKASKIKEELPDLADEVSSSSSDSTSSSDSSDSESVVQPSQEKTERDSSPDSIIDRTPRQSKRSGDKRKSRAAGTSSFSKIMAVSDSVKEVTGQQYMRRCDVVKSVWAYIKENDLRDPNDKNYAICDEKLRKIFEMDRFKPFSMMKHFQKHIFKPEDLGEEHVRNAAQAKKQLLAQLGEEDLPKRRPSPKRASSGKTTDEPKKKRAKPFQKVLVCSDALAEVTGKQFITRSDTVKALWSYIRTNNLLDPKNRQFVKSDANFEKIFRSKRFKAFGMMGKLGKNLLPPEEYGPEWVKMAEEAQEEARKKIDEQEQQENEAGPSKSNETENSDELPDEQEEQENEVGPSKSNETKSSDELPNELSQSDSD